MVITNAEIVDVVYDGSLALVIARSQEGKKKFLRVESRYADFLSDHIGSNLDLGITSYGTIAVAADPETLDPEADYDY